MRVYLSVFGCALRRYSGYRAATAAGLFTNSVFGVINALVLLAVFAARPQINGYTAIDAVTQVYVAQALLGPVDIIGRPLALAERIRSGDVAVDLLRPAHPLLWFLAQDLGRAVFAAVFRSVPTFCVGLVLFRLALPQEPARWAAAGLALLLAVLVSFALRYLYALAGFWIGDARGVTALAGTVGPLCSGLVLPLVLFPDAVAAVLRALPWSALVQVPAEIVLGKATLPGGTVLGGLVFQAAWAAALLGLGALLTARAARRVAVQGG
ncbi:ABC transporter permease [Streptomonospora nanhaiensis]|uniref:ABC-2 type transport system permease protein n=1 Tax=Streptomonospora nanhaiensis TaxID=1323731 RepID=A0A853BH19_9ACTN|nr:ABC-2 family transporter protein [Streptomonospora nanhaiensis]MBV2366183.1 ABC-2 family transporter protein [Streptomonospora nanhaiensis]MBX9386637.1 ABC-2 family transporter protein [Streptomonospora nanhaiensis]NYI94613.1 ABC-2 type transport system permease protein [Streptomonospora nanhaiensis]